jgi:hypothetical protein
VAGAIIVAIAFSTSPNLDLRTPNKSRHFPHARHEEVAIEARIEICGPVAGSRFSAISPERPIAGTCHA